VESLNNDDMQKCTIQEEQRRMTDDAVADLVNHAVDDYLEDARGEEEKAHRMSHNGGLNATETIQVYTNNRGWHDIAARKGRRQVKNTSYLVFQKYTFI
jgi:hypothetical protein